MTRQAQIVRNAGLPMTIKRSKYGNRKTVVDGITFASAKEAKRFGELKLLEKAGVIADLTLQPRFPLKVNGLLICTYVGDFTYRSDGASVVEDSKGFITPEFRLKKKLMLAVHGIEVVLT